MSRFRQPVSNTRRYLATIVHRPAGKSYGIAPRGLATGNSEANTYKSANSGLAVPLGMAMPPFRLMIAVVNDSVAAPASIMVARDAGLVKPDDLPFSQGIGRTCIDRDAQQSRHP
jgi:hypothetical protein